jgi:hypothetical protein
VSRAKTRSLVSAPTTAPDVVWPSSAAAVCSAPLPGETPVPQQQSTVTRNLTRIEALAHRLAFRPVGALRFLAMARHHYAIVTKKTRGGRLVEVAHEYRSRGEADIASLRLVAYHPPDRVLAVTVERDLAVGDVLPA